MFEDGKIVDIIICEIRIGGFDYGFLMQILCGVVNIGVGLQV